MKRLAIILSLLLMLGACSEEFEPKPFTYSQLLTGKIKKSWRLAGFQYRVDGKAVESFNLPSNDCFFDDLFVFYANEEKRFEINEGNSVCTFGDPQIFYEDSWALVNANATLEMAIPFLASFKLPYILRELKEDEFSVEIYFNEDTESYRFAFELIASE